MNVYGMLSRVPSLNPKTCHEILITKKNNLCKFVLGSC